MRSKWIEENLDIQLREYQRKLVDTRGDVGLRGGRRVGKSTALALVAIHDAWAGDRVAIGASSKTVLGLIFDTINHFLDSRDFGVVKTTQSPQRQIKFDDGGRIDFFVLHSNNVHGISVDKLLLDEADYSDGWMDKLVPSTSQLIAVSTPDYSGTNVDFKRWCENEIVTEIVVPSTKLPHWDAVTDSDFKKLYSPEMYKVEILAEWPEVERGIKELPKKVQLYWKCQCCGEEHLYPQERAKQYCDDACKQAAYRMRKNSHETV